MNIPAARDKLKAKLGFSSVIRTLHIYRF